MHCWTSDDEDVVSLGVARREDPVAYNAFAVRTEHRTSFFAMLCTPTGVYIISFKKPKVVKHLQKNATRGLEKYKDTRGSLNWRHPTPLYAIQYRQISHVDMMRL